MSLSTRERHIAFACVLAAAFLAADQLALTPYFDHRQALQQQKEAKAKQLADSKLILTREHRLKSILAKMGPSLDFDASAAEVQLLRLLHDWEQRAGVANTSFRRVRSTDEQGFTHLSFQVSATGSILAVAALTYSIETAKIPLRIDDLHLASKKEGQELTLQMNVSTLCKKGVAPRDHASPETALLGGQP